MKELLEKLMNGMIKDHIEGQTIKSVKRLGVNHFKVTLSNGIDAEISIVFKPETNV